MSRFHGLSFGKIRQPAWVVPGPATPPLDASVPPELDAPELDAPELDAPELDAPELDAPELDAPELGAAFSSSPQPAAAARDTHAATRTVAPIPFEMPFMVVTRVYPHHPEARSVSSPRLLTSEEVGVITTPSRDDQYWTITARPSSRRLTAPCSPAQLQHVVHRSSFRRDGSYASATGAM